ncbi:MAG: hypothetical protein WD468_07775 [Pirellulales bacterium]
MKSRRINSIYCNYWHQCVLIGLAVVCAVGGCWREVEYTAPDANTSADQPAPSLADHVADKTIPSTPTLATDSRAEDDPKAAASEFGKDLAATLSEAEPTVQASESAATTPTDAATPVPKPDVGDRYAATTPVESSSPEVVESTTTPPDSLVNNSMLPEEREAIAEISDVPIPNLNDDDIQTPPAVAAWNTRRAAWLLGSKLSLAALANEHGAPAAEVQKLFGQSSALAKELDIPLKSLPARPVGGAVRADNDSALDYLFNEGQDVGGALASQQSADHAALFEVAVKSNILLVLYKPGAPTTEAIAAAIERAGERAKLPATLWRPLLDALAAKGTLSDVRQAVYQLHEATDKYLDEAVSR